MKAPDNFSHYISYLQHKQYSIKTTASYLADIKTYQKWTKTQGEQLDYPSYNLTMEYIAYLKQKGNVPRTQAAHLSSLKCYFTYLRVQGIIEQNPIANLVLQGVKRELLYQILSIEQLNDLYHGYPEHLPRFIRNKVLLSLVIYQGISVKEIKLLELSHINLSHGTITIPQGRQTNERTMELKAHQGIFMSQYLNQTREQLLQASKTSGSDYLFFTQGKSKSLQSIYYEVQQHIKPVTLLQIRVSMITHWLKLQGLRKAQYLAGHRYVSSTEKYLSNDIESLTNDLKQYRPSLFV
jgi:site-specific recombinase XerD